MNKIKPKPLAAGSHIRIVSPSSSLSADKLERGAALLVSQGYEISYGKNALKDTGFFAGTDEERASDLTEAFADPSVDAVFCSRGGYGAARLLKMLDLDAMASSGKMFCGFSDITTLHLALNKRGLVTFHSPMLFTLHSDREPWVIESLLQSLKGENPIPESAPVGECVVPGIAEGELTGGCLVLVTDSLGTPNSVECEGKILILEDVDEKPHRVDAMLTHLINSGQLENVAGIVVGEMTGTNELADPTIGSMNWKDIIIERLAPLGKPLIVDFPFGHRRTGMLTLPLGIRASLDAESATVSYLEKACRV